MAIYSRKKKKSGFRIFIYSLFFLSVFLILGYYFFYPTNLKTVLDETSSGTVVEIQNEEEKIIEIDETKNSQSDIEIDLSNYLQISDLDKNLKEFIQNNPKFIIDVLRKYQDEQNKIEQEKISQKKFSNESGVSDVTIRNRATLIKKTLNRWMIL